jgi:hypothetical protein
MQHSAAAARDAVLAVLGLLEGVRDRVDQAPVRRGKPARMEAWRAVLGDRTADAFPRRLAAAVRVAKERVGPVLDILRAARAGRPFSLGGVEGAPTAAEYVIRQAEEVTARMTDGLPAAPARTWMADDEVTALAARLDPLLAGLPSDLIGQIDAEFAGL